jgi:predicted nucleotidyltransferase
MNAKAETTTPRSGTAVDLARLESYLAAAPRVVAATVFGSARDGWMQSGSDLDVAVLFDRPPAADEFLRFYTDLCDQLPGVEKVDLVVLNQADPILAFEALRGRFLCKNDSEQTAAFFSLVCREYEDVMAMVADQRRGLAC